MSRVLALGWGRQGRASGRDGKVTAEFGGLRLLNRFGPDRTRPGVEQGWEYTGVHPAPPLSPLLQVGRDALPRTRRSIRVPPRHVASRPAVPAWGERPLPYHTHPRAARVALSAASRGAGRGLKATAPLLLPLQCTSLSRLRPASPPPPTTPRTLWRPRPASSQCALRPRRPSAGQPSQIAGGPSPLAAPFALRAPPAPA